MHTLTVWQLVCAVHTYTHSDYHFWSRYLSSFLLSLCLWFSFRLCLCLSFSLLALLSLYVLNRELCVVCRVSFGTRWTLEWCSGGRGLKFHLRALIFLCSLSYCLHWNCMKIHSMTWCSELQNIFYRSLCNVESIRAECTG